jgi:hypothetical protein
MASLHSYLALLRIRILEARIVHTELSVKIKVAVED